MTEQKKLHTESDGRGGTRIVARTVTGKFATKGPNDAAPGTFAAGWESEEAARSVSDYVQGRFDDLLTPEFLEHGSPTQKPGTPAHDLYVRQQFMMIAHETEQQAEQQGVEIADLDGQARRIYREAKVITKQTLGSPPESIQRAISVCQTPPDERDPYGYDVDGRDEEGFDWDDFDDEGYDRDGYSDIGLDRNGLNRDGSTSSTLSLTGYDSDGRDSMGDPRPGDSRVKLAQDRARASTEHLAGILADNKRLHDQQNFGLDNDGFD